MVLILVRYNINTYHSSPASKLHFLASFQWIILPKLSCLLLYSCASLVQPPTIWSILLSVFLHSLYSVSFWILSIFALTSLLLYSDSVQLSDFLSPFSNLHSEARPNFTQFLCFFSKHLVFLSYLPYFP